MFAKRIGLLAAAIAALSVHPALAQKQYGPGTSDTEIQIGQTIAYSGPASAYGTLGKVEAAYFKWLNDAKGGINGRKIIFISRDDAYSPPKAVENARSLVEGDEVALIFGVLGTPLATPGSGIVGPGQSVALKAASGAAVHFTTNGSTPTSASPLYSSPIAATQGLTIKAIAVEDDWTSSTVLAATYVVDSTPPVISTMLTPTAAFVARAERRRFTTEAQRAQSFFI